VRRWCPLAAWLLVACGPSASPDFRGADIHDAGFGRRLELTDHHGTRRSLDDFHGKIVVLFFGYTHCPDICPTTLVDTASALKLLPADDAARVQVLFVSIDPERDDPATLKQYVPYFNPDFLGLWGTPEQIARAAKEFRVFYRKHAQQDRGAYTIDHTAGSYVIDAEGHPRLMWPYAMTAEDMAHDLRALAREHQKARPALRR
jgi:protein SCO1